ncbi:MAG TPA: hypothetical protein VMU60_02885 [Syntrophobacteria bacterium]|nr:hypothetical protein [Syntrophobacteria bacterium]
MGCCDFKPTRAIKPLFFASLFFCVGWALYLYAYSNEVLSLKMPPFLVVEQLTALGSVVASLGVFCWLLAFLAVLSSFLRVLRRGEPLPRR